jgi:hypothetical protein
VGFRIDLVAKSRKGRGLFRKGPDPREVGDRLARLARRMLRDAVSRAGTKGDRYIVELACHPAAPPATLVVEPSAEIHLRADVAAVGPGYQLHLVELLDPILDELDYAWTETCDLAAARAALCLHVLGEVREAAGQVRIGMPDARRFRLDAPVLTPLGPRDEEWRVRLLADAAHAADTFAWWDVGPGRKELSRALLAMSLEVPWREPLDADERELMTKVDEDLRAARKADPALALPWPEWKELLLHLGIDDEEVTAQAGDRKPTLGYRRHELEIDLSGGWRIVIPGALVGRWDDDGAKYWATDGDRAIEFSSLTAPDEQDSAKLLAVAPERHPVLERIADGARCGRAEAFEEAGVPIVIGLMTKAPHVGILTVKGGTQEWALATWRSLQHD